MVDNSPFLFTLIKAGVMMRNRLKWLAKLKHWRCLRKIFVWPGGSLILTFTVLSLPKSVMIFHFTYQMSPGPVCEFTPS